MTIDELVQTIDRRIADAQAEAQQLEAAKASLVGSGTAAVAASSAVSTSAAPAATPRRARPRAGAARVRGVVVPLPKLLTLVGEHPGETTSWLAKTSGADQGQLLALLKENEGTEVRREGERRATRWFRITDEDRISARAAELASRSAAAA